MKIIDRKDTEYDKVVEVFSEDHYHVKTNNLAEDTEIICPQDSTMKICKKEGKIYIKKISRLNPF